MNLTIVSLLDVVDRLGWIEGRTDLLTYPEYVLFKGIDTMIDEKRIRLGLKLNVYALPFNPKVLIQESSVIDHEHVNEEKQEENKITSIKHNTNTQRQTQEKWVEVSVKNSRYTKVKENEKKTKQQQLDKSSMTKKKTNRYQDLKEKEEEEEEIKIEEDYTVEIKTNAIGDVKEEKVISNTYEINKMTLDEVERFCVQDAEYTPKGWKNNGKNNMQKEDENEDDTTLQNEDNTDEIMEDIQSVPVELLDEAESKLQVSVINEEQLRNENSKLLRKIEANDLKNTQKISSLEIALKQKTELLIAALKDMGEITKRRKGSVESKRRSV